MKFKIFAVILIILVGLGIYFGDNKNLPGIKKIIPELKINYEDYFYNVVKVNKDKKIYTIIDNNIEEIGTVYNKQILSLTKDDNIEKGYYNIKDTDYYIDYKNVEKSELKEFDDYWKNYIPYNESIEITDKVDLYLDKELAYTINSSLTLPIIIKDDDYYGVIYKDKLFYVKKDTGNVIKNINTDLKHTNEFSTLVYHATYDHTNSTEKAKCIKANSTICLSDIEFDKQMKYLKDNNYYTATMKDVSMFVDGKVQLPKKTVAITIDDGYFADAAVKVLEKYDLHATIFLIGELANLDEWKTESWYSKNIELHSHTYNMHNPGKCEGGQGSILKCGDKQMLLDDLKKSREQLNGTTVFCYPFFEYNDYAIKILKEAGFEMAFAGGRKKIKVGQDKMKLSRFGIINTSTLDNFIATIN